METYAAPRQRNTADQMVREDVDYFVDLVNQAEQAHFSASQWHNPTNKVSVRCPCRIQL